MHSSSLLPGWIRPPSESLPRGWRALQLKNITTIIGGGRLGLTKERHYRTSGYPAFSAAGQDGYVEKAEFEHTDAVVLSAIGANCGRCFLAQGTWTTLANVQALLTAPGVSARFLHYRVNRDGYWPRSGSAQPFIKPGDIGRCWVCLPPHTEQRRIADVLDGLDEAIRRAEQIVAKLKQIKQGLLHDLLTRGIDDNGELRDPERHPEQFKDSPLGSIPREWDIVALNHVVDIIDCKHFTPRYVSEGYPLIRPRNIKVDVLDLSDIQYVSEVDYRVLTNVHEPKKGDIVFSRNASFGVPCYFDNDFRFAIGQDVVIMTEKDTSDTRFTFFALQSQRTEDQIRRNSGGSTFGRINLGEIRRLMLALPPKLEQERIADLLDALKRRQANEETAVSKLRLLKQGLMEDLLTGRVRVTKLEAAA